MAEKVFGLYGPGTGPWVYLGKKQHPRVQISKLVTGNLEVRVSDSCTSDCDYESKFFTSDGTYSIPRGKYVKAIHEDLSEFLMVNFIS